MANFDIRRRNLRRLCRSLALLATVTVACSGAPNEERTASKGPSSGAPLSSPLTLPLPDKDAAVTPTTVVEDHAASTTSTTVPATAPESTSTTALTSAKTAATTPTTASSTAIIQPAAGSSAPAVPPKPPAGLNPPSGPLPAPPVAELLAKP